ncbi:MAG: hypothetical protein RLZZ385_1864 [Pseudomonadota bacterium]
MTIKRLCRLYGVSRSGFYAWQDREESARQVQDRQLGEAMMELHQGFRRCYGARRLHKALRQKGFDCSVRRVSRLMKTLDIKASTKGLYSWQPGRQAYFASTGNKLAEAGNPNQAGTHWAGDFTYITTKRGYLFFAVVMDLYTRKVIGWSGARTRGAALTKSALASALYQHKPKAGCLFHSDQGIEYAAQEFREYIEEVGLIQSMSRKASPIDNATVESFFHSFKTEAVQRRIYDNELEAMADVVSYINFYNQERLHSSLGYQTPLVYEKLCA